MQLVNELLIETVEVGDLEALKVLLENGADVNYEDRDGNTSLMQTVEYGFLEVVKVLLENGADVNYENRYCYTFLMWVAEIGDWEIVKILLASGADANYKNRNGNTSLILAAENGRIEIFNILLLYKTHVYHKNQGGFTALTCSIKNKDLIIKTFKEFLKFKNEIMISKGNCYEKIIYIIKGDDDSWLEKEESVIDSLEYLQNEIKKLNEKNNSNIEIFWQKEVINSLVFDELNYSLLRIAVINDWQKLVTYLINKWPIDIDYKDNSGNSAWNHTCLLLQKKLLWQLKIMIS
ncbi:ankyrin repeat domain-containing protein [Spiroplasma endosymbiont of Danaus chrysippus]|uniref:ankyrin repeat domain-containing protein n=1 Tax=Spiroplasma endosymbiont of Danaus chrysippus TaxID=2691041 RepID=UPI00157BB4A2|nr:ankyrin repeat domain-containing protein [Spiroplasma endosymbiont of Danaus chrysippus]